MLITSTMIILTNAYMVDSRTIDLDAEIIDSYTLTGKGRTKHYNKIEDQQLNSIIKLRVQKPYPGVLSDEISAKDFYRAG